MAGRWRMVWALTGLLAVLAVAAVAIPIAPAIMDEASGWFTPDLEPIEDQPLGDTVMAIAIACDGRVDRNACARIADDLAVRATLTDRQRSEAERPARAAREAIAEALGCRPPLPNTNYTTYVCVRIAEPPPVDVV